MKTLLQGHCSCPTTSYRPYLCRSVFLQCNMLLPFRVATLHQEENTPSMAWHLDLTGAMREWGKDKHREGGVRWAVCSLIVWHLRSLNLRAFAVYLTGASSKVTDCSWAMSGCKHRRRQAQLMGFTHTHQLFSNTALGLKEEFAF